MRKLKDGSVDRKIARDRQFEGGAVGPVRREEEFLEKGGFAGRQAAQGDGQGFIATYPEDRLPVSPHTAAGCPLTMASISGPSRVSFSRRAVVSRSSVSRRSVISFLARSLFSVTMRFTSLSISIAVCSL